MKIRQALKLLQASKHRPYRIIKGRESEVQCQHKGKIARHVRLRWMKNRKHYFTFPHKCIEKLGHLENTFHLYAFDPYGSTKHYIDQLKLKE